MRIFHEWRHLTDIEVEPGSLTDGELGPLARVWAAQKENLREQGVLGEFERRLRREWSIETGIIENVYTLDRGVTQTLIEKGIDAAFIPRGANNRDSVTVARIIQDHYEALEGMFDFVNGQRELSTGYVKELHQALLKNDPTYTVMDPFGRSFEKQLELGKYKDAPNSPMRADGTEHQYCPPEHVAAEMDRLIEIYRDQVSRGVTAEVQAAWLHHRFTQIHPFADGNGRVARALATLVFIKANWFPLIVKREDYRSYIDTLEAADSGDLKGLVGLFVGAQRDAVIQASEVAYDVKPISTADEAIAAVRDRLLQKGRLAPQEWEFAKASGSKLHIVTLNRFREIASQLTTEVAGGRPGFVFAAINGPTGIPDPTRDAAVARAGQRPDFSEFGEMALLRLDTGTGEMLSLSFHALGPRFRGLVGVLAYLHQNGREPIVIRGGTFQTNYEETTESAEARFNPWLEHVIVEGLNEWRKSL